MILTAGIVCFGILYFLARPLSPPTLEEKKENTLLFWSRTVIGDLPLIFLSFIVLLGLQWGTLATSSVFLIYKSLKYLYRTPGAV